MWRKFMENTEYKTVKDCLKASELLLETLDNADHSRWNCKEFGEIMDEAEKLNKRIQKLVDDDEVGELEDFASYAT